MGDPLLPSAASYPVLAAAGLGETVPEPAPLLDETVPYASDEPPPAGTVLVAPATIAVAPVTDDIFFSEYDGIIIPGGDICQEIMTLQQAKARARKLPDCKGFCFRGPYTGSPVRIWFKSHWEVKKPDGDEMYCQWFAYKFEKPDVPEKPEVDAS